MRINHTNPVRPADFSPPQKSTFKFAEATELMNRPYEPDFLIEGLFERNALGQIFGATGSGKSFVVLDMCYCIAAGLDYCGFATKQGSVAYICGEGFRGVSRRIKALQNKYGGDIREKLFISEQPGAFVNAGVTSEVAEAIAAIGNVQLVVVDTYHRNMGGGNENSADDFGLVLRNIDAFLKPLGVTTLIVHHSGHMDLGRVRGSSSIKAAMDFEYQVTKSGENIILKQTKVKDGVEPTPMAFVLVDCEVGTDTSGKPRTSAYLEYKGAASIKKGTRRKLSARDDAILQTLNDAIATHGIEPSAEIKDKFAGFNSLTGRTQKIVHMNHWREVAYKTITTDCDAEKDKPQALRKAFQRCRDKLFNDGFIVVHGDYVWRVFDAKMA